MKWVFLIFLCGASIQVFSQDSTVTKRDSTVLEEIIVHGYANDRSLSEVPAAIGVVTTKNFERFNNASLLQAINTIPGVRMEERSPGSYRFAVRGSSLRSPFGVRNVKMYWNGLPLTDGSGNTYLNLIDFNGVGSAEVIKGPGSSLYGAGTGGTVFLKSPVSNQSQLQASAVGGSFGLQRYQINGRYVSEKIKTIVNYAHQQADGYRQHTAMRKDAFNIDFRIKLPGKGVLLPTLFYTDLYYQTPGGLTKAQYQADPTQARPSGATPGAEEQHAAVYNKTLYGGLMYDVDWDKHWSTQIGVFGSNTSFLNPTLRNYEVRNENNYGGRLETHYRFQGAVAGKIALGGEYQNFYSPLTDYDNNAGAEGKVQTDDRLYSKSLLFFGQAEFELPANFFFTAGGSGTFLEYNFHRISDSPPVTQERKFDPVFSPRIALLKKLNEHFSAYGSISRGFSPPSLAEVRPSTSTFNSILNPEVGTSYEIGLRGAVGERLTYDVAVYDFELDQTIVVQEEINGADFFHNAGRTRQKGVEIFLSWMPSLGSMASGKNLKFWGSYTLNHYRFLDYVQNGADFSGNQLTGTAKQMASGGIDLAWNKLYVNVTLNYVDKIPLNDANSEFASSYFLAGTRVGYRMQASDRMNLEFFGGVDNATNTTYSLGNDLNAAGGRYYNVAPARNFYVGLKMTARKRTQ